MIREYLKKYKVLVENFFSLSILNVINVLLPMITIPYLMSVLKEDGYGSYYYIYTLIQLIITISNYGFNFSATKSISQNRDDRQTVSTIFNSVIASKAIISLLVLLVIWGLSPFILKTSIEKLMFLAGIGMIIGDIFNPVWFYQGVEKMRYITIVNVSSKLLFTILVFFLIHSSDDLVLLLTINSAGYLLAGILSIVFVRKIFAINFHFVSVGDISKQIKEGAALFGSTMGINLYRRMNVLIMKWVVGDDAVVGIYSAAEQIIRAVQSVINPIAQALFPHFSQKFKKQNTDENLKMLQKIAKPMALVVILGAVVTGLLARPDWLALLGEKYQGTSFLIRLMLPVIVFGELNYLLGFVGLINLNKQKYFFSSVLITGIFSILVMLCTAYRLQEVSGAAAMSLAEILLFVLCVARLVALKKKK